MPGRLQAEIQQSRPFESLEEEAVLNIVRTAEVLSHETVGFLREFELSPTQYNVLRILRGAGAAGVTCSGIAERMITRDPDITRLLDRMEARGVLSRERSKEDRRVVVTTISAEGLALLGRIDQPLRKYLRDRMGRISKSGLESLIGQLEQVRDLFTNSNQ